MSIKKCEHCGHLHTGADIFCEPCNASNDNAKAVAVDLRREYDFESDLLSMYRDVYAQGSN